MSQAEDSQVHTVLLDYRAFPSLGSILVIQVQQRLPGIVVSCAAYNQPETEEFEAPILNDINFQLIAPIVSAVVAVVSFLRQLLTARSENDSSGRWTAETLHAHIRDELLAQGIIRFDVEAVANFEALRKQVNEPCIVVIRDLKNGDTYLMSLLVAGSTTTFRITSGESSHYT